MSKVITLANADIAFAQTRIEITVWIRDWLREIGPFSLPPQAPGEFRPQTVSAQDLATALRWAWSIPGLRFNAGAAWWDLRAAEMEEMLQLWANLHEKSFNGFFEDQKNKLALPQFPQQRTRRFVSSRGKRTVGRG